MKHKSIFNAVGISAVAAIFCVGCSEDDNPPGKVNITKISVNDEQVYGYASGALESNYSCSFTNFSSDRGGSKRLADILTNPVVNMTNGKLTVDLGEPVAGLKLVRDAFEDLSQDWEVYTISDLTANILTIDQFTGDCRYDNSDDRYSCNSYLFPGNLENRSITLFYADKPVTIGGYIYACVDDDDESGSCSPTRFPFSFNLQIGWNVVSYERDGYATGENYNPVIKTLTTKFYGPDGLKWEVQVNGIDRDSLDRVLVVPAPTTTPIGLVRNKWTDGSITSSEIGSAAWYSFNVTDGEKYYVWLEGRAYRNSPKTLDLAFSIVYSDGSTIYAGNGGYPSHSFTADRNGMAQIRVAPEYLGSTGTFAVAYTGWDIDKRPDYP
jgi:hypothetical protein